MTANRPSEPPSSAVSNETRHASVFFRLRQSLPWPPRPETGWILWAALFVYVSIEILSGSEHSVVRSYRVAAQNWIAGERLYQDDGAGFIYLPHAAVAFVPFAVLPRVTGEICWRFVTIGVFVLGLWRFARLAAQEHGIDLFGLMSLISVPLAFSCARNGQSTLPMAGLMLLATADLADQRWWRATLWLTLGMILKPLTIVLVLLAAAIYPAMRGRLCAGIAAVCCFPFLFQRFDYVMATHKDCIHALQVAHRVGVEGYWAQLFGMLRVFGLEVPQQVQTLTRLVAAVATLGLCWYAQRRYGSARANVSLYVLTALYLMLFNPRTENNTYAMLGPALAVTAGRMLFVTRQKAQGYLVLGCAVVTLASYEVGKLFVPTIQAVFLAPLATCVFAVIVVVELCRRTTDMDNEPQVTSNTNG